MPTFSDTSYLARICYIPFILVWMIVRTWQTNRWEPVSFLRLIRLEPRSLFTFAFLLALLVRFVHDIILYSIKINEGYLTEPIIIEKPESFWVLKNLRLYNISHYLNSISLSFTITSLFISQIFWNYIMEQTSRKQQTGAWEYWTCLVLALLLLPIFPIIVYLFDALFENPKYKENVPRLSASGIALILCFIGGLRVHISIGKLLNLNTRPILQNSGKLEYFQDLNLWFNISLFIWSISYIIISIDGMLTSFIITKDFISDLLIANANFGEFILYICLISIFNPDFSLTSKQRIISTPFDVIKTDSSISVAEILGPDFDSQIRVETSQNIKIEHAYINPNYRPYSTTPPLSPISNGNVLLTPMPSPSSTFAVLNRNQRSSPSPSPLQQSWRQGQNKSEVSSQQTLDNDQAILTEHVDKFGTTYDDESIQTMNEPQIYMENYNNNNIYYNNPIRRLPSQDNDNISSSSYNNNNNSSSYNNTIYDRSNSM
ncbi:hypothetical protein RhiirA4_508714 [Rhizophagus irregularis]|uniref:Uncharacterized protein n=1 Tax=Rhizophagus irregularis TaxID=588596 RepID=A0A2I1G974_9GLOM|nr:hypothetical protein RhiirA4_508714 [Rhizophagus irregularis]